MTAATPKLRASTLGLVAGPMEWLNNDGIKHGQHGQNEQDGITAGIPAVEGLAPVFDAADDKGKTHHQEQVAQDGTRDGSFDQLKQPGPDGGDRNDKFGGVAEGGVEQSTDARTGEVGQRLGRLADISRHWDDCQGRPG